MKHRTTTTRKSVVEIRTTALATASLVGFMLAPSFAAAQQGYSPCWAQGKALTCQSGDGSVVLVEAPANIDAATASAEGHLAYVAGGKLWLRAVGSASSTQLASIAKVKTKTCGKLVGIAFSAKGLAVDFVDREESQGDEPGTVGRTVPLPKGIRAVAPAKPPAGQASSMSGNYKAAVKSIQICDEAVDTVEIEEGQPVRQVGSVDSRAICKEHFQRSDDDCSCMCGLGSIRWLLGDALVASYGGGCGSGWSFDFLWRPGLPTAKLSWLVLSPDGRQGISDLGWSSPRGWLPAPGASPITSAWLPNAALPGARGPQQR